MRWEYIWLIHLSSKSTLSAIPLFSWFLMVSSYTFKTSTFFSDQYCKTFRQLRHIWKCHGTPWRSCDHGNPTSHHVPAKCSLFRNLSWISSSGHSVNVTNKFNCQNLFWSSISASISEVIAVRGTHSLIERLTNINILCVACGIPDRNHPNLLLMVVEQLPILKISSVTMWTSNDQIPQKDQFHQKSLLNCQILYTCTTVNLGYRRERCADGRKG